MITRSDFEMWWNSPVGTEFRNMMREDLDKLAHGTMEAAYARDPVSKAIEVGKYQAILHYNSMTYDKLTGEGNEPDRH